MKVTVFLQSPSFFLVLEDDSTIAWNLYLYLSALLYLEVLERTCQVLVIRITFHDIT
jgi:hypothetical protein